MTGIELIAAERERQIKEEGFDLDHDKCHVVNQLAWAAVCYAAPGPVRVLEDAQYLSSYGEQFAGEAYLDPWPWTPDWDKRKKHNRKRQLAIAGALIAAEIDLLNALEEAPPPAVDDGIPF